MCPGAGPGHGGKGAAGQGQRAIGGGERLEASGSRCECKGLGRQTPGFREAAAGSAGGGLSVRSEALPTTEACSARGSPWSSAVTVHVHRREGATDKGARVCVSP